MLKRISIIIALFLCLLLVSVSCVKNNEKKSDNKETEALQMESGADKKKDGENSKKNDLTDDTKSKDKSEEEKAPEEHENDSEIDENEDNSDTSYQTEYNSSGDKEPEADSDIDTIDPSDDTSVDLPESEEQYDEEEIFNALNGNCKIETPYIDLMYFEDWDENVSFKTFTNEDGYFEVACYGKGVINERHVFSIIYGNSEGKDRHYFWGSVKPEGKDVLIYTFVNDDFEGLTSEQINAVNLIHSDYMNHLTTQHQSLDGYSAGY